MGGCNMKVLVRLMLLDQVFGLAACAIERRVNVFRAALLQRGDHITDIEAPAQHIVFLARAGLHARHGPAFPGRPCTKTL